MSRKSSSSAGLTSGPRSLISVISPNVLEAEELVGHEFNDDEDRALAVREMVHQGAREAIMTLPDGCVASVLVDGAQALRRVWIAPQEGVAVVGAGDAFLAGFVACRYQGHDVEHALRFGVACGAESTKRLGAGLVEPREVERLLAEVAVEALPSPAQVG